MAHGRSFKSGELAVVAMVLLSLACEPCWAEPALYRKCCPELHGLSRLTDELSAVTYQCIGRPEANRLLNGTSLAGAFVVGEAGSVVYGFPEMCDSSELVESHWRRVAYSPDTHCLDKVLVHVVNGTAGAAGPLAGGGGGGGGADAVVALGCEGRRASDGAPLAVERVRKCCADGHEYDAESQRCRASADGESAESLARRYAGGGEALLDVQVGLRCRTSQVVMTYGPGRYELAFESGRLAVRRRGSGERTSMHREDYCVERAAGGGGALAARGCRDACDAGAACVRKCCALGQHHEPVVCGRARNRCVDGDFAFNPTFYRGRYMSYRKAPPPDVWGIAPPYACKKGRFALSNNNSQEEHFLLYSGELVVPLLYNTYATEEYCLETVDRRACGAGVAVETVLCYQEQNVLPFKFKLSFIVICISCLFLMLTLLVYAVLSELRNVHGMTLMSHAVAMLLAYGCLARVQYGHIEQPTACKLYGYLMYFAFIAAFSWLCVMCFDIWWTFGSMRTVQRMRKAGGSADRRRFALYSLCAWGAAIALTLAMLLLDLYPVSTYLDANIGTHFCWFGSIQNDVTDWPHYIFMVVPLGVVMTVNLVLWVCTARHCARVKSELHRMQNGSFGDRAKRRFRADRAKYTLVVKLWVVMGAGWTWEVISTMVEEPRWLWLAVDITNQLQGFFIFVILVLKPKVYFLMRKRFGLEKNAANLGDGGATSTRSTFLSTRSISADERAQLRVSQPPPAPPPPPATEPPPYELRSLTSDKHHDHCQ